MPNHANFAQTTLGAAITDTSGTSITVASSTGFPAVPFICAIDTECFLVSNVAGTTWTVTRGYEGSTAATHLNGAAVYHDWSAGEADSTVHGPSSATDAHLAVFDGATGKRIKDGGAVPAAGLPTTGGTMSGDINMGNNEISFLKLLKLNGEIDDAAGANPINWNAGVAHKVTLGGNVTLAFTGRADAVPTMTAYDTPSGVVSADSETYPYYAYKAFDDASTYYTNDWIASGDFPHWLQYRFASAQTITAYSIRPDSNVGDAVPTAWTLQGSSNGTDFTTIDTVTASGLTPGGAVQYYTVDSPGSYLYYRLVITAASSGTTAIVNEMELFPTLVIDPAAPCFLSLKLVQDATGGRTVTWPATVKGTPAVNLAANAVSNVLLYWDGTNYYVVNGKQFASATDKIIGRSTAGAGELEEITCTAAGRALLDDANAAAQLTTLGAAAASTTPVISTGTAAPTTTPAKIGDIFIDTTGAKAYIAKGTASSADWVLLN